MVQGFLNSESNSTGEFAPTYFDASLSASSTDNPVSVFSLNFTNVLMYANVFIVFVLSYLMELLFLLFFLGKEIELKQLFPQCNGKQWLIHDSTNMCVI